MSNKILISTKEGLNQLLSIISEESVSRAREELSFATEDERMRQANMSSDLGSLKKYQKKNSKELQPEEDDDLFDDEPDKKKKKKPEPDGDEKTVTKKKDPESVEKVTFTMIKDKINTLRSGHSLRDEKVRGELKDYFKRLEDKQQAALFSYLDGISQILTAGMQGEEAHAPGEPHSSKHLDDEEEADEDEIDDEEDEIDDEEDDAKALKLKKKKSRRAQSKSTGIENTAPPIDVGTKQRTESIRRMVRELMG
tara:strand:+ start:4405 stop:5163 length:759 start_codon:yes stop_codon:yes gene_type:complete